MSNAHLHTDSGYVEIHNLSNPNELRTRSAEFLASREKELYAWVGESTYDGFISKLREEFNKAAGVKEALENFKKGNLVINLQLPEQLQFTNQQIEFSLNSEVSEDIAQLMASKLSMNLGDLIIKTDPDKPVRLSFEYNEMNIKTFLNSYFGQDRFNTKIVGNKRSDKTNPLRHANKAFKQLASENKLGDITINGKPVNNSFTINTNNGGLKSNFEYKKEDIEKAINTPEGQQLRQNILNSIYIIKETLMGYLGGNEDLKRAFLVAWQNKIGDKSIDGILNNFSFFAKGGNLNAGVSGAIQELYTAIIAEYINIKIGQGINHNVAKILGNVAEGNEQPKTDVQILGRIGVQVKAYSIDRAFREMKTDIHPGSLEKSLKIYGSNNIADSIVQMVFNSSNGNYNDIADDLEPALAQLMNMTTSEDVSDTVCFYMVDAQYLVPGSEILNTLRTTDFKITIRTGFDTKDDAYFKDNGYEREDNTMGPNFLTYFNGDTGGYGHSFSFSNITEENYDLYNSLMNHDISIDVKFDYTFMFNGKYAIY